MLIWKWQVDGREGRNKILFAIALLDELVVSLGKLTNFLLAGVLRRRQKIRLVVWILLQVLNLLFAVKHLPALDAKDLSIRFLLDSVQSVDEGGPLGRVSLYHYNSVYS